MTLRIDNRHALRVGLVALFCVIVYNCAYGAEITLSWQPSEGATGYTVYACDRPDSFGDCTTKTVLGGLADSTTWTVDLENESTYFTVKAFNSAGESWQSNARFVSCSNVDAFITPLYLYSDKQLIDAARTHLNNFERYDIITPRGRARLLAVVNEINARLGARGP